jgi:hypothetical protein
MQQITENDEKPLKKIIADTIKSRLISDFGGTELNTAVLHKNEIFRLHFQSGDGPSCLLSLISPISPKPHFYLRAVRFVGSPTDLGEPPLAAIQEAYEVYDIGGFGGVLFRPSRFSFFHRNKSAIANAVASSVADAVTRLLALFIYGDSGLRRDEMRSIKGPLT